MKTVNVALAVLTVAASAGASAQNSVTLYGVADAGLVAERGCVNDCPSTKVSSGIATTSHIGVRGSEQISENLNAVFGLEAGIQLDTGRREDEDRLFNRQAYVGLSGNFGSLTLGRQFALDYLALRDVGDPFKGGMAGTATNLIGYLDKQTDDSIRFERTRKGIFTAASYTVRERYGDVRGNRNWGISLGIQRGPLTIRAAHQKRNATSTETIMPAGKRYDSRHSIIAANLRVGPAIAYTAFGISRGYGNATLWNPTNPFSAAVATTPSTDSREVLVGLAVPSGPTTWLVSFIRKNDREFANNDADQVAFGASYALSRRTDFYAAVSRIHNRRGANYTVGNASDSGSGDKAINIGMRHAF
ncbi:porin [Pseudoduganella sp. GCM10020061]|uniref:porin n=1 Tax=Pseudoduganella sp. GCM10020061 TaxID=3317345 RepID=UPI00362FC4BE